MTPKASIFARATSSLSENPFLCIIDTKLSEFGRAIEDEPHSASVAASYLP